MHRSVISIFKGGGLDFAQDRKFNFFLSPGGGGGGGGRKSDCHEILSGVSVYEYLENEF